KPTKAPFDTLPIPSGTFSKIDREFRACMRNKSNLIVSNDNIFCNNNAVFHFVVFLILYKRMNISYISYCFGFIYYWNPIIFEIISPANLIHVVKKMQINQF